MFLLCITCKNKNDVTKEKEAVLKVLQEAGDAFAANDEERLFALHIRDETSTRLAGTTLLKGWSEIETLFRNYFKANSTDSSWVNPRNIKENTIIKVVGNSAWVVCDNIWEYEFKNIPGKQINREIAFLEKINGEWKISFNAFIPKPTPKPQTTE